MSPIPEAAAVNSRTVIPNFPIASGNAACGPDLHHLKPHPLRGKNHCGKTDNRRPGGGEHGEEGRRMPTAGHIRQQRPAGARNGEGTKQSDKKSRSKHYKAHFTPFRPQVNHFFHPQAKKNRSRNYCHPVVLEPAGVAPPTLSRSGIEPPNLEPVGG